MMNKLIKFVVFEAAMLAGLYVLKTYTEKYMDLMDEEENCGDCEDCCCATTEVKEEEVAVAKEEVKSAEVKVEITQEIPVAPIAEEKPKRVVKPRTKKPVIAKAEVKEEKPKEKRVVKPRVKKTEDKKSGE